MGNEQTRCSRACYIKNVFTQVTYSLGDGLQSESLKQLKIGS